jgi:hypothetical protein
MDSIPLSCTCSVRDGCLDIWLQMTKDEMYHVCILEHSEVHLQKTMHKKFHNPSGDNMSTSIMGFMWQRTEYSLHSQQKKQKKIELATVL